MRRLSIRSRPGAELSLERHFFSEMESSEKENGLEKCSRERGEGLKTEGKLGKKQEGGQMVGKRSFCFSMLAMLLRAPEGSNWRCLNRWTMAQKLLGSERGVKEAHVSWKEFFFA